MSLLLDALKKAEQEKLKAREAEAAAAEGIDPELEPADTPDAAPIEQQPDAIHEDEPEIEEADNGGLELLLDEDDDQEKLEQQGAEQAKEELEVPEPQLAPMEMEKSSATTSTVSDEALHLLIYKTNKNYRQRQRVIWGSLVSVAIVILMLAGTYYYFGMLEEVDALERKHKLAMRAVSAEPVKRRQSPVIVESTVVEEIAVQSTQSKVDLAPKAVDKPARVAAESSAKVKNKNNFSIKKTKAEDPVSVLLRDAWLAYNRADYAAAQSAYESVLNREPKNRDAILGMAAIAVKNTDYKKARAGYSFLLKLNPRDQVAIAAMTNLEKLSTDVMDESKLKFILQQQPSATHLNFALGNYYAKKSQWPEAQSEYFKAWQGNSENADYAYNLAVSLDQLGKTKQALRFYKESLILSSEKNIGFSKSDVNNRIKIISEKQK